VHFTFFLPMIKLNINIITQNLIIYNIRSSRSIIK